MKIYRKTIISLTVFALLVLSCCFVFQAKTEPVFAAVLRAAPQTLITTRGEFIQAIKSAKAGETLYVGDIDFNLSISGAANDAERITIEKGITVKNGKESGRALFSGGSVILSGGFISGKGLDCTFEGIAFDGEIDTENLTADDWALTYDGMGELISPAPLKAQYAVSFNGNVNALFENCTFSNYMYPSGGAINAFYGESSDNKVCELNLVLNGCCFTRNAAKYGGGAAYLAGNKKNVKLIANNCTFNDNTCEYGESCLGGGAVYAEDCITDFYASSFIGNSANRVYGDTKPTSQNVGCGGAMYSSACDDSFTDCVFAENIAAKGGALSFWGDSSAAIDGCVFAYNEAKVPQPFSANALSVSDGIGAAAYLNGTTNTSFLNTSIYGNYAQIAYGSVFKAYSDLTDETQFGKLSFALCTAANNTCGKILSQFSKYPTPDWEWFGYPGDFWGIPFVRIAGSLIADDTFEKDFPRYEMPGEHNNYNYFASCERAGSDGILSSNLNAEGYAHYFPINPADNGLNVPVSFLNEILGDTYHTFIGRFHAGSNFNNGVRLRLNADGGKLDQSEILLSYGSPAVFPDPVRTGYDFMGWYSPEGTPFVAEGTLFAAQAEDFDLVARWQIRPSFVMSIVIPIAATLLLGAGIAAAIIVRKRKNLVSAAVCEIAESQAEQIKARPDTSALSPREKEILNLLLAGKQRSEIGQILYISENTVKKQITSLYQKLNVKSRSELFSKFR